MRRPRSGAGELVLAGSAGNDGVAGSTGVAGESGLGGTTGGAGATGTGGTTGEAGSGAGGSGPFTSLLTNGDFSSGETNWHVEGNAQHSINNGTYCVTVGSKQQVLVGWNSTAGMPLGLQGSYKVSYQASSSGPLSVSLHLKIGHDSGSFATVYETDDSLTAQTKTFEHTFNNANDSSAGLAFTLGGGSANQTSNVCFDDVSLTKQ